MHRWGIIHMLTGNAAEIINPLRERFDPASAAVIGAHLTLAGPFDSPLPAESYADHIASVAARFHAFPIAFMYFDTFMPISCTNYAKLEETDSTIAIHDALIYGLPLQEKYSYVPHVTITEYLNADDTIQVGKALSSIPLNINDLVSTLSLVEKGTDGIWRIIQDIPLSP